MENLSFKYGTNGPDDFYLLDWKINGRGGNDTILGYDPSARPDDGVFVALGGRGDDDLKGYDDANVVDSFIYGGSGNDKVVVGEGFGSGQSGDDQLRFTRWYNHVDSTMAGGSGDDTAFIILYSGAEDVVARGGTGSDGIYVDAANGDVSGVRLSGGDGDDGLRIDRKGGEGTAVLRGNAGDHVLEFKMERYEERVRLSGGTGADSFGGTAALGSWSYGRAVISDFNVAEGDRIALPASYRLWPEGVQQSIGGSPENTYLSVSYRWFSGGVEFFTSYKLLGLDAPLSDAAFI